MYSYARTASLLALYAIVGLATGLRAQTPTLTISPAVISNDYVGSINLTISNLAVGQKVVLEKYFDLNGNGTVDSQEPMPRRFSVTDGAVPLIGGQRNYNVPGDEDGLANGQIHVLLSYPALNATLDRIAAPYLFRLVDTNGVGLATNSLTVLQNNMNQGVTGTVYSASGAPLANTVVVLIAHNSDNGYGTVSDAGGNFSVHSLPGSWTVFTVKNGYLANTGAAGATVTSNVWTTINLTNPAATCTLSGQISDSGSSKGLSGIMVQAQGTNGFMSIAFTDSNGNYTLGVVTNEWKIKIDPDMGLTQAGYVQVGNGLTADTYGGSLSNVNLAFPKATALIYGQVLDNHTNPVSGLGLDSQDSSFTYDCRGLSISNGYYSVAVFPGTWYVGPGNDALSTLGLLGQQVSVSVTNNQAVLQNVLVQHVTAHVRGRAVDGFGAPLGNINLSVLQVLTNFTQSFNNNYPPTQSDGTFDIGLYAGNWSLQVECDSAANHNVVSPNFPFTLVDGVDLNNVTLVASNVTGHITVNIVDNNGNPVSVQVYATPSPNGNWNACGGNSASAQQIGVFNGLWQIGISGDLTPRGYDNPPNPQVFINNNSPTINLVLYPHGQTPTRLSNPSYSNGQFQFTVTGAAEALYRLDMTTNPANLAAWTSISTNQSYGGIVQFSDFNLQGSPRRFYRTVRLQ
jgi:hypothetical protein